MHAGTFPLFIAKWIWLMTSGLVERSEGYISNLLTKKKNPNWKKKCTSSKSLEQLGKSKRGNMRQ